MKKNKNIWFSNTLGKWLKGVAKENNAQVEYVKPIGTKEYLKAIDNMLKDSKKKKITVYLNGIPTVMVEEE